MNLLYNILINCAGFLLKILAVFNKKMELFVSGRKGVLKNLKSRIKNNENIIWFHCASLGEFEQGRPVIEKLKNQYPTYKILITFFSPSGYEVRKNYSFAEVVSYLPLDTKKNAKKFIDIVKPKIAIFVKYEFWPNILNQLKLKGIDTILISGIFRKDQIFFKWYGGWMKTSLNTFNHFFLQNANSKNLLNNIGFNNCTINGDTRFDRVFEITQGDNYIEFIDKFVGSKQIVVAGSTWPKDEELIVNYINNHASNAEKYIIAPHNVNVKDVERLKKSITKNTVLFSENDKNNIVDAQVLIIDSIGILTKVYSYATIAYVGGGFGAGIHNILEPASFGIPILIGPNYHKFKEAKDLVSLNACEAINNSKEFNSQLKLLFDSQGLINTKGKQAKEYVLQNTGATQKIIDYLIEHLSLI